MPSDQTLWTNAVDEISRLHGEILVDARSTLQKAIRIGELLSHVKATLKHGEWMIWVNEFAPFSIKSAERYLLCFDKREEFKFVNVTNLTEAYALALSQNAQKPAQTAKLHEPNFHSRAVRLRQSLVGEFNHYLQRRPLRSWFTEEIYDLLCSLTPLSEVCHQLETELDTRDDVPAAYREAHTA